MTEKLSGEEIENNKQPTLAELLPRYNAYHPNWEGTPATMYTIDDHEMAMMDFVATDGGDAKYSKFVCACDLTEDVGWGLHEKWGVVSYGKPDECEYRKRAVAELVTELHTEYTEQFSDVIENEGHIGFVREVMKAMIAKDNANEFVGEVNNGAHFWGGHFYMQTLAKVVHGTADDRTLSREDWKNMWLAMDTMMVNKQVQLEGMVIQDYYEPPEAEWMEYGKFDYEGHTATIGMPAHMHMDAKWQVTIAREDGTVVAEKIAGPSLMHEPVFGPDAEDVANVEYFIRQLIDGFNQAKE